MANVINIRNKKATHDFELSDRFIAGIQLYGTEIKSIRQGKASITDSYCVFIQNLRKPTVFELWVKMHVAEYSDGTYNNHEPKRDRKLLLTKRELKKLERKVKNTGLTIVPTRLFINDRGYAKLEIAVAQGKKYHDKREDLKTSDAKMEMDRAKKSRF
jgi:SsrA-binding protein